MTSTTAFARILSELSDPMSGTPDNPSEHTPFHLATLADCYSPDTDDSPGARFLARIARDVSDALSPDTSDTHPDEMRNTLDNLSEAANEIAYSAVPIYTHNLWQVFVDLGAYNEDVTELMPDAGDDLTGAAGAALYMIARRLVHALADELSEALDEDDEDGESGQDRDHYTDDQDRDHYVPSA